jgi:hypothetical protein
VAEIVVIVGQYDVTIAWRLSLHVTSFPKTRFYQEARCRRAPSHPRCKYHVRSPPTKMAVFPAMLPCFRCPLPHFLLLTSCILGHAGP